MNTVRLTAAQGLLRYLANQFSERDGVRRRVVPYFLGVFGHGNLGGIGQALEQDEGQTMRFLQPKNEQAMVHTAIGYARANRRLSTLACSASIGPGSTNMVTGAAAATVNRIPVLLLPSDTFASRLQGPPMQALDDPAHGDISVNDAFRPLSTFFDRIARPEQLLSALPAAVAALLDPERAGAVTVCLHQDLQAEAYDYPADFFNERTWSVSRRPPAPEELEAAAQALVSAERPLIIAGGGVHYSDATDALRHLAERHGIPVAETSAGKGALRASELSVGAIGHSGTRAANRLARQADLVLCVGTRLIDLTTGSNTLFETPDVRFVGLNVATHDARKQGAQPLQADARRGLEGLCEALDAADHRPNDAWLGEIREAKRAWERELVEDRLARPGERMSQHQVLHELNAAARASDALVVASGTPHVDVHKAWDTSQGADVQMEVGFSTMGHEIPAALGLRLARGNDGEVFVLIGDGTFLMAHSELVTAVQERLKLTVVVIDNHGYQSIHALQRGRTGRSFGLEFRARDDGRGLAGDYLTVDYAAVARSYGCEAFEADTPEQVAEALTRARAADRSCVVVCRTEPHRLMLDSDCWWDVGVAEVSTRPETDAAATRWAKGRSSMRWLG